MLTGICDCTCHTTSPMTLVIVACHRCCDPCPNCRKNIRIGHLMLHSPQCKGVTLADVMAVTDPFEKVLLAAMLARQARNGGA